jgi:PAS domain S-box-containing protein
MAGSLAALLMGSRRAHKVLWHALPAWCVLAICLGGTALAWHFTHVATVREAQSRFETEIGLVQVDLSDRLRTYEQVLRGGVSAFYSWPAVTRENWRRYVANLGITENYPGIQGLGFAQVVSPSEKEAHSVQIRSEGLPHYRIWPEGERAIYTAIIYLEPFDWRNRRAIGYDMFSEPVRRAAMEHARDTGQPSFSGKVTLVQEIDEAVQVGFLMYLPVYRTASPADVKDRQRELIGYVYSPFRMGDFMHGLLGDRKRDISLEIFDGKLPSDDTLMYSTMLPDEGAMLGTASFVKTVPLPLSGHTWTLRFSALPSLPAARGQSLVVAGGGVLVSCLLSAIVWSVANHRTQVAAANDRLRLDIARREQIEAQLREKETGFRYLFEKNPNPMWVFDRSTLSILEVNDAAVAHYGYSRDEFRRMGIAELRPAEDVRLLRSYMQDRPPGLKEAGDWRHITKDGRTIDVEITSYTLDFQQREAVLVVARDITESKRAEEAVRESEAVARGVLNTALDAYIRMDQDGRITDWNAMAETIFGWRRSEAIGRAVADIIVPQDQREAHQRGLVRFLASGEASVLNQRIELQALHRNERQFPIELTIIALNTAKGWIFSAFIRDLTDKKHAEGQLRRAQEEEQRTREREARFRALLESAPDAVVISDTEGRIVLVNVQTERLFGYPRDQLVGQTVETLVPERSRARHVGHRSGYITEAHVRPMGTGLELYGVRADKTEFPIAVSLSPVETNEGTLIVSAIRDITDQRAVERKVEELNARLTRDNAELATVNKELEAFSYSVSHDLRAPLRAIDGFSQALLEDCAERLDDGGRNHLTRVRQAAQRMGLLIDDLLKLSRVTRADVGVEDIDLDALAREIVSALRANDPQRTVEVEIVDGLTARGDPHLLRIVLENLLGNAWKFTAGRSPARIKFGQFRIDGKTAYYVRDNGVGFDMAYADQLFRAFQRLHDARAFPGTGIGLATVQRIIHKHGGRVWADAKTGKGATFHFTL